MDYGIREWLQNQVYGGRREKFKEPELRNKILESWEKLEVEYIRKCIRSWKPRLRAVVEEGGGHIDHLF